MQEYISVRRVRAKPMRLGEYTAYMKWPCKQEDLGEEGYLIECFDKGITNHKDHDGYISWMGKKTFELNYTPFIDVSIAKPVEFFTAKEVLPEGILQEKRVQVNVKNADQITPSDIEANIASEHYFTAEDGVGRANRGQTSNTGKNPAALSFLTFCVLVLKNGFTVTGESYCFNPERFNEQTGQTEARKKAVEKVWPLLTYELRTKLGTYSYDSPQ